MMFFLIFLLIVNVIFLISISAYALYKEIRDFDADRYWVSLAKIFMVLQALFVPGFAVYIILTRFLAT